MDNVAVCHVILWDKGIVDWIAAGYERVLMKTVQFFYSRG